MSLKMTEQHLWQFNRNLSPVVINLWFLICSSSHRWAEQQAHGTCQFLRNVGIQHSPTGEQEMYNNRGTSLRIQQSSHESFLHWNGWWFRMENVTSRPWQMKCFSWLKRVVISGGCIIIFGWKCVGIFRILFCGKVMHNYTFSVMTNWH